ncbi:MAG: PepSY domain-containing protein [Inquilinus sp.]|nr:PepSY domain-containing protein [Inquilinus sp.]
MKRRAMMGAILAAAATWAAPVAAQNDRAPALSTLLRRLQGDPAYAGRIVGTHVVRAGSGTAFLYEVRILSPDDRIVIVHLDPDSGAVVGNPDAWLRRRASR